MGEVLVVGSGVAGIQASTDIADFGHHVFLVEREKELGGNLRNLKELFSTEENAQELLSRLLSELKSNKNITIMEGSEVQDVSGQFPKFNVKTSTPNGEEKMTVNSVVLATGFKPFDPSSLKQYGFGKFKDVITSLELEEMLKKEKLTRPSNLEKPNSISIIQCVGSRDSKTNTYCSSFCCMYAVKLGQHLKREHPEVATTIIYMDMRTPYEGEYDYADARLLGVRFLRGKPAKVREVKGALMVQVEDTLESDLAFVKSDLVVLSVGGTPDPSTTFFGNKLNIELSASGFFQVAKKPVNTNAKGIFVVGAASGPKDIPYSMMQGSCAAAKLDATLKATGTL